MAFHFEYNLGNECSSLDKSVQSKESTEGAGYTRKRRRRY